MLYVKIMGQEDISDTDQWANYTIVPVANNEVMKFRKNPAGSSSGQESRFILEVHAPEGGIETHELTGNAYVMTESGKTIATHGS